MRPTCPASLCKCGVYSGTELITQIQQLSPQVARRLNADQFLGIYRSSGVIVNIGDIPGSIANISGVCQRVERIAMEKLELFGNPDNDPNQDYY